MQWTVIYKDGTVESGLDNLSSKAFNNPDLTFFKLIHDDKTYSVDLTDGTIVLNGFKINSPFNNVKYRLIYYRVISTSLPGGEIEENIPHIGWQITLNGKNIKRIFRLSDITLLGG